jgi:hypothetical protein
VQISQSAMHVIFFLSYSVHRTTFQVQQILQRTWGGAAREISVGANLGSDFQYEVYFAAFYCNW